MPRCTTAAARFIRVTTSVSVLAVLAACASHAPRPSAVQEAAAYAGRARANYVPPGSAADPWGPYIREAAARFDVPEMWIRAVMQQESGGKEYANGAVITSSAGAMGLMQVMPATYDDMRAQYSLGSDPFDPHDNILAGSAYMRQMYDIYGSPGFLAAYNCGPNCLDDYLSNNRPLPGETRHYVAMIGPEIEGVYPEQRSQAEQYAINALPIEIPPGRRYGRPVRLASRSGGGGRVPARARVQIAAQSPEPPREGLRAGRQYALVTPPPPPPPPSRGFHLVPPAYAETVPFHHAGGPATGGWAIQVGAFANETQAQAALSTARERARVELAVAHPHVASVHTARAVLWRARLTGLSREAAATACEKLAHGRASCIVLSPEAQS